MTHGNADASVLYEDALKERIRDLVEIRIPTHDSLASITDDTDLLLAGVIDSFGYLELIEDIEKITGTPIDLDRIEETDMATIAGLARQAVAMRT